MFMRYLASVIITVASSLWLGGLVSLAFYAPAIFKQFGSDRATAGIATSAMFVLFAQAQLYVAGAALFGAFLGYLVDRRSMFMGLFVLFGLATVGAVMNKMYFVAKMEELRASNQSQSGQFKDLHKQSMYLFVAVTTLVAAAVVLLPALFRTRTAAKDVK